LVSKRGYQSSWQRLIKTPLPAIAVLRDGRYLILGKASEHRLLVQDPLSPRPILMLREEFEAAWDGRLVLMTGRAGLTDLTRRFGISWFVTAIHKYRYLLGEVLVASFFLQLFALVSPLSFQVVIDKVLASRTLSTTGFGTTQSIDLTDINYAAGVRISYASNSKKTGGGVLTVTDGTNTTSLQLQGKYTLANFHVASDGNGGTLLTDPTVVTQRGNAPAAIGNNAVLEVEAPDTGSVTFTGTNGTLWLDQPTTFSGTMAGLGAQNSIDLPGIAFNTETTLGYLPNSSGTGGTLSVSDGGLNAKIALLGTYMASNFVMESDNHGGTAVVAEALQPGTQIVPGYCSARINFICIVIPDRPDFTL
jgi:Peptidase C39 family